MLALLLGFKNEAPANAALAVLLQSEGFGLLAEVEQEEIEAVSTAAASAATPPSEASPTPREESVLVGPLQSITPPPPIPGLEIGRAPAAFVSPPREQPRAQRGARQCRELGWHVSPPREQPRAQRVARQCSELEQRARPPRYDVLGNTAALSG
jgi:hypothetical protein